MDKNYQQTLRTVLLRRGRKFALLTAIWLGISSGVVQAQVANYGFVEATATYTPITGGTSYGTTTSDDQPVVDPATPAGGTATTGPGIPIGFSFPFNGENFDRMAINVNGWISLGQSTLTPSVNIASTSSYNPLSSTLAITPTLLRNRIAGFARDLESQANGNIRVETIGATPNQVCVIQWENYKRYGTTGAGDSINFQIRLYESGMVEIHYGPSVWLGSATTVMVGMGGAVATDYNSRTSTTSWTGTAASTANSNTLAISSSINPPANLIYRFTVPQPMVYSAAQVFSISNRGIGKGTVNNAMAVLNIQTLNSINPLSVTDIQANTGTTALANIENLKIFYTGSSTTFSTATQFGSTVAVPAAANTVSGTQTLLPGNNYFWITYDVKAAATTGDSLRVVLPSANVGGTARVIADSAAALPRGVMAPISGTFSVGTGQTYTSLGAFFTAINTAGLSGNVTANIVSNITEPAPAVINRWAEVGGSGFALNIRATGGVRTISGAVAGSGVIVVNGAARVNIDGRIGGAGRNLIIENTSANATQVGILLISSSATPATNNVIRNLVLKGSLNNTGLGTVAGIQAQGNGHDSLLITENHILFNNLGINVFASATPKMNVGVRITNNIIGSDNPAEYVTSRGIFANIQEGEISGNKIYNFVTTNSAAWPRAIETGDTTVNTNIFNNSIDRMEYVGTSFKAGQGIFLNTATTIADANVKVYNNAISGLKGHGSSTATNNSWGIVAALGKGYHIWNNSISITDDRTTTSSTDFHGGILVNSTAVTNLDIRNNNIYITARPGNVTAGRVFGIRSSAAATSFDTLDYNNIYVDTLNLGVTGFLTSNRNSLADWQTATGKEANSKAIFPNFQGANLLIPNSAGLDNSGTPITGLTTDITGATRNATTPDIGAYEFSPINTDISALAIGGRVNAGCFTANENFTVQVKNTGLQALNFATNALTVRLFISGAVSDSETVVINTGTLNAGDTLNVAVNGGFNMTAFGTYTLTGSANVVGDGIAFNNNFASTSLQSVAPVAVPFGQTFEGVSLADLTANNWSFSPNWNLAANNHGNPGNGLYFNLYSSADYINPRFAMPSVGPVTATSNFSFSYRMMNWSSYPADSFLISGADSVVFEISTDCGATFSRLYKVDSINHTPSRQWSNISVPMTAYAGQNVIVRFRGHWGSGDWYLDLDNVGIASPVSPVSLIAPANNALLNISGAGSTTINARWSRASADPVTYTWLLSDTSKNFAAPLASFTSNNNGLDTVLTLNYYQLDALMASLGIPVGSTALATWTVRITSGGSTSWAVDTFDIRLNRVGLAPIQVLAAPVGGTGTSTARGPNGTAAHTFQRAAMITLASEFAAAGIDSGSLITSMGYGLTVAPTSNVRGRFRVWLLPTDSVTYTRGTNWNNIVNGMTLVADDSVTISATALTWSIPFTSPVMYGGKSWNVAWEFSGVAPFAGTAATYSCNTSLAGGLVSGASAATPPATLAATAFRTELRWGVERRANDLDVITVFALGRNPRVYGAPERVRALVRNNGFNASSNVPVTLTVSGANTFTSSVNVSLGMDSVTTVEFPYTAAATGFNTISVSVPADNRNINNQKAWLQQVTDSIYSYADSVTVGNGSVGFNTGSGLLLNKYRVSGTRQVKAARIKIGSGAEIVGKTVTAVVTNDTGLIVAQSAPVTLTATDLNNWVIFPFQVAPNFTDTTFMIGLAQTAATPGWFPVAFQAENPTRPNAYFSAALGGGSAGAVAGFRLMIEAHVGAIVLPDTLSAFNLLTPANNDSINVNGAGSTALNFTWQPSTRSTTGAVTYTWTLETTNANPVALITRSGLTSPNVSIDYSALADTLTARGIAAGNSFNGRWRVVASSGTLTRAANANFNIKLRRGQITSIEESAFSQAISLYPNPANGVTTLEINGQFNTELEVVVVNAMGQEMIRKQMQPAMGVLPLDLSALNQGMYFVRISNGQELAVKRLMIQR